MLKYLALFLILTSVIVSAKLDDSCLKENLCSSDESCVLTSIDIVADSHVYAVGDEFYYDICLKNIGLKPINTEINISSEPGDLFQPKQAGRIIPVQLQINEERCFSDYVSQNGKVEHRIYTFQHQGEHKIAITVPEGKGMQFFSCKTFQGRPIRKRGSDTYSIIIDVVSPWEREWQTSIVLLTVFTAFLAYLTYKRGGKKKKSN